MSEWNTVAQQTTNPAVAVLDWPVEAARVYAEIRPRLESSGKAIGAMEMLIAAHAIHEKAAVVTRNLAEFRRMPGLKVESLVQVLKIPVYGCRCRNDSRPDNGSFISAWFPEKGASS